MHTICICIYMCVCIYIYIYMHVYIVHMYTQRDNSWQLTCTNTCIYTHTRKKKKTYGSGGAAGINARWQNGMVLSICLLRISSGHMHMCLHGYSAYRPQRHSFYSSCAPKKSVSLGIWWWHEPRAEADLGLMASSWSKFFCSPVCMNSLWSACWACAAVCLGVPMSGDWSSLLALMAMGILHTQRQTGSQACLLECFA